MFQGNGPLYVEDWNEKGEASPWFDLVRGDWMPDLQGLTLDSNGEWTATDGLFDGEYELNIRLANDTVKTVSGFSLLNDDSLIISVPEQNGVLALTSLLVSAAFRRRKTSNEIRQTH